MWVAPSMWPVTHSSSSRTSRTTASSGTSLAGTVGTCCGITRSIVPPAREAAARPAPPRGHGVVAGDTRGLAGGVGGNPVVTAGRADRMGAMTAHAPAPVRDPAWSLSRSAIGLWVTEGVIGALVWAVLVTAVLVFVPDDALPSPLRWALVAFAVLEAAVTIGIRPWVRYRVHRWEVTGEAVYTLTGWLTRTWTLVPISRIQTVDVTRGVLQQLFGLATVAVLTASSQGTVRVLHLEADVAHRVADDLAPRAGIRRASCR